MPKATESFMYQPGVAQAANQSSYDYSQRNYNFGPVRDASNIVNRLRQAEALG